MPYSTAYPAENASFASIVFFERYIDGIGSKRSSPIERVSIHHNASNDTTEVDLGNKTETVTIQGYCGTSEASSLRSARGSSGTLVWSQGSMTAYLWDIDTALTIFDVYEITLTFTL